MERTNVEVLDGGLILIDGGFEKSLIEPIGMDAQDGGFYDGGVFVGGVSLVFKSDRRPREDLHGWTLREFAAVWAEALWRRRNPGGLRLDPSYRMPKEGEDV